MSGDEAELCFMAGARGFPAASCGLRLSSLVFMFGCSLVPVVCM